MHATTLAYIANFSERLHALKADTTSGYTKLTEQRNVLLLVLDCLIASDMIEEALELGAFLIWHYNVKDGAIERHLADTNQGWFVPALAIYPTIKTTMGRRKEGVAYTKSTGNKREYKARVFSYLKVEAAHNAAYRTMLEEVKAAF